MKDIIGYETLCKKDKKSELALIINDRFIINLKSDGESDEGFLKGVAKDMKLGDHYKNND
ncbi:MAG: hypothetical protein ABI415_00065 [Flavitalea sp.]